MKYCGDCGSSVGEQQKFCTECGTSLGEADLIDKSLVGDSARQSDLSERDASEQPNEPVETAEASIFEKSEPTAVGNEKDETAIYGDALGVNPLSGSGGLVDETPLRKVLAYFATPARVLENRNAFILAYLAGMIPTYLLPYVGSNSTILNSASALLGFGGTIQFWLHVAAFVFLFGISAIRGPKAGFAALWLFPLLAMFADFVPGLNWIPLLPSGLHLIALFLGARSRHEVQNTEAPTLKLALTAAGVVVCIVIGIGNLSALNNEIYNSSESFGASDFASNEAPTIVRNFSDFQSYRDNFLSDEQEYVVTGRTNVRDYPTSENTSVVRSLDKGMHVFAREVQAFDPSSSWYKLRDGGYVWSSNLQRSSSQYGDNCPPWTNEVNYDGTFQVFEFRPECPYVLIADRRLTNWFYIYGRKRDGREPNFQDFATWDTEFRGNTEGLFYWRIVPNPAAFAGLEYVCIFIAPHSGNGNGEPSSEQLARYKRDVANSGKNCPEVV